MSNYKPGERPSPSIVTNTLSSIVRCAIDNGLSLTTDVNGHVEKWAAGCRDEQGNTATTEHFFAEWDRQLIAKLERDSTTPAPEIHDE